jgi:translation elongation factor EF-Tu-like GTPase
MNICGKQIMDNAISIPLDANVPQVSQHILLAKQVGNYNVINLSILVIKKGMTSIGPRC